MDKRFSKNVFLKLPWWFYSLLGSLAFIVLQYVIPQLSSDNLTSVTQARGGRGFTINEWLFIIFIAGVYFTVKIWGRTRPFEHSEDIRRIRFLTQLEFAHVLGEAFKRKGYTVIENVGTSADEDVYLELTKDGSKTLVQCAHWKSNIVTEICVQEHLEVMASKNILKGIIACSGVFSSPAAKLAGGNAVELINAKQLIKLVSGIQLSELRNQDKTSHLKSNDACPICGGSTTQREATQGAQKGTEFLVCSDYPRCSGTISL